MPISKFHCGVQLSSACARDVVDAERGSSGQSAKCASLFRSTPTRPARFDGFRCAQSQPTSSWDVAILDHALAVSQMLIDRRGDLRQL
jgi:hypothetical protein